MSYFWLIAGAVGMMCLIGIGGCLDYRRGNEYPGRWTYGMPSVIWCCLALFAWVTS